MQNCSVFCAMKDVCSSMRDVYLFVCDERKQSSLTLSARLEDLQKKPVGQYAMIVSHTGHNLHLIEVKNKLCVDFSGL